MYRKRIMQMPRKLIMLLPLYITHSFISLFIHDIQMQVLTWERKNPTHNLKYLDVEILPPFLEFLHIFTYFFLLPSAIIFCNADFNVHCDFLKEAERDCVIPTKSRTSEILDIKQHIDWNLLLPIGG